MGRTGRGCRLGTRTDRATSWIHNSNLCSFYGLSPSEKSPRRAGGRANGLAPPLACQERSATPPDPCGEDPGRGALEKAAPWPCKRSELANLDKRKRIGNEGRRKAAGPGKVAREARRREAAEGVEEAAAGRARPAGLAGGGGERPAGPGTAGGPRPGAEECRPGLRGPARDANAPHHAQEAAAQPSPAQPRPGSHSSRLPFPQPHAVRPRDPATPVPSVPLGFRSQPQNLGRQHT